MGDRYLIPGDILFTASTALLGRLIRWGERSPGETAPSVNHAAIVVACAPPLGDAYWDATIVEAMRHVQRVPLRSSHSKDSVFAFRPVNVPLEALDAIVATAEKRVGEAYSYVAIAEQLVDSKLFGGKVVARALGAGDKVPICSRLVAQAYGAQGYDFGLPGYAADPDTMLRFCLTHPKIYQDLG